MFRDYKSGGYNSDAARSWGGSAVLGVRPMSNCRGFPHERLHQDIEGSNVVGERFISLVIIISFAYFIATIQGEIINKKGVQNYVARVKEYGRSTKRHSNFYIGMYAQKWINIRSQCWELVNKLMRLSRHKLDNYLRGMRAMKLIQSTF